jgi:bifunctional pyridoxal-dependent enzyme with beta-cystathionase and maltose regulon repressor activities
MKSSRYFRPVRAWEKDILSKKMGKEAINRGYNFDEIIDRFNFACPRALVKEALDRITKAILY